MESTVASGNVLQTKLADAVRATFKHEEWKYTNLASLLTKFGSDVPISVGATPSSVTSVDENRILVLNGLAQLLVPEARLTTTSIPVTPVAGTAAASPFVAFVSMAAANIIEVHIPANTVRSEPITIDVVTDGTASGMVAVTRVRVVVGKGAQVVIHERHHGYGDNECMDMTLTEIVAEANSLVQYVKHTQLPTTLRHIGSTIAYVHAHAQVRTHTMSLGGPYVRNDLYIRLEESGAEAYLDGLSTLHASDIADNHTAVDHLVPRCHSEELYKGIYHDASTGIFSGKIYVRAQAQKTTAYQSCRSLVLGDRAQVNVKPQLEIWADDVKCSHGATTGQLDTEALFYLRSRGLSLQHAKDMLVDAFAQEIYDRLPKSAKSGQHAELPTS